MGKVDREHLHKLAALAHLTLTEDEYESLSADLERILGYAERIQRLDTEGVEAVESLGEAALREDEPRPGVEREQALSNAPDSGDGLFKVPKVLP